MWNVKSHIPIYISPHYFVLFVDFPLTQPRLTSDDLQCTLSPYAGVKLCLQGEIKLCIYILYELKFSIRKAGVFIRNLNTKETGLKRIPRYTTVVLWSNINGCRAEGCTGRKDNCLRCGAIFMYLNYGLMQFWFFFFFCCFCLTLQSWVLTAG